MKIRLKKRLKLKIKAVKFYSTLSICFIILFSFLLLSIPIKAIYGSNEMHTLDYVVEEGDNLWTIATNLNTKNTDIREIIYDIRCLNSMQESSSLTVGQKLILPVYY